MHEMRMFILLLVMILIGQAGSSQTNLWQQTNGPYGGMVNALVIDSSGCVLAGTAGGFYRSTDLGGSWLQCNSGFNLPSVYSIAFGPNQSILVGTASGVYRSTDGGFNWVFVDVGSINTGFQVVTANQSGLVVVGTVGGNIYVSTDGGYEWSHRTTGYAASYIWTLAIADNGYIFAGTPGGSGILRSTDQGNTWSSVQNWSYYNEVIALCVNPAGHIFAGTFYYGAYRSTDNGDTWTEVNTGIENNHVYSLAVSRHGDIFAGAMNPGSGPAGAVYRSTNDGDIWTTIYPNMPNFGSARALVADTASNIFVGTFYGGLYRSTNGGVSWHSSDSGLTATPVSSLSLTSGHHLFAGSLNGLVYHTTNAGATWKEVTLGRNCRVTRVCASANGLIFGATQGSGIFSSTDDGENWIQMNNGLTFPYNFRGLAVTGHSGILASSSVHGVYRSTNDGGVWVQTNAGLTDTAILSLETTLNGDLFAGTWHDGVFHSTDEGFTWRHAGSANGAFYVLTSNSNNDLFGVTDSGFLHRSTNHGETWTQLVVGSQEVHIECCAISVSGTVYAGTLGRGVYCSYDNGDTWVAVSTGLPPVQIEALLFDGDGFLFAATSGEGVFRTVEPVTSVMNSHREPSQGYPLKQNYPNPFNPSTTIEYQVPQKAHVMLKVFDSLGREVAGLVDEVEEAGIRSVKFDGTSLASGVYFYRLQVGSFVDTKKFLLLR